MSQPSIYPALYVKPPDFLNALQQYANVAKTDAETQTELQKPDYVRSQSELNRANVGLVGAQSVKAQVDAELARINLGVSQYGLDALRNGGNAGTEALPGQSAEGTSYAQPDVDPARYATATPPPTTGQQAVVDAAADKYGVPKQVAYWVGTHESGWNRNAVGPQTSHGQAQGAWQFMGDTAKDYGLSDPTDFASSTDAAMHYLADLYKKTGDWGAAIQAYGTFSTGRGAGRDAAVREGFNQYAKENGLAVAGRTQVAAAGNGPASWGVRSDGTAAPAAVVSGGNPNALSVANPMGTSSQGIMLPGLGVALPKFQAMSVLASTDKAKAINEAIQQRRLQLGQLAGGATDAASWNQAVATAWRTGWITNGEFQRWYNAPDWQGMRDTIVRSMAPPEAQLNYTGRLFDKGFTLGPGGQPQFRPEYTQGQQPVTIKRPVIDPNTGQQARDAQGQPLWQDQTYSAPAYHAGPGAPGGGAAGPAPAPAAPSPAPAPPPAAAPPPPGQTAPNGGTIAGPGAATPPGANGAPLSVPPGMEPVKGTDNNWYLRPVQGAGPAAPTGPAVSGTVTAPAPAGNQPVTPPGAGPVAPIVPPGAGGLAPGAIGGGPVIETPGTKLQTETQTEQRKTQIAALGERVKSDATLINEAQTGAMHSQTAIPTVLDLRNRVAALPASAFGAWGQERSVMDNILQTISPDAANKWAAYLSGHKIDPSNAGQLQAARKEFFQLVTSAESQLPGTRIGARLTSYFSDAMPSLNMQKPQVQEMLNFLLVGNQLAVDYAQEMAKHYNSNFASYTKDGTYAPIAQFDEAWTKPGSVHAPGVYEAAARILNGSGTGQWDKGLTRDQQQEALSIVARADPAYHFRRDQLPGLPAQAGR